MKRKTIALSLLLAVLIAGCSPQLRGGRARYQLLQETVDQHLRSIFLKGASWSIMAVDLDDGRILLNRDADRSLIPGSNMKLLTTACALETLEPEYRITTEIGYTGKIDAEGVLHGDLIVIGAGDPTISTQYDFRRSGARPYEPPETFIAWADSLARNGVRSINGSLKGYSSYYTRDLYGSGWEWSDLKHWYGAEISPLIYVDGCIEITIIPADSIGSFAAVEWSPNLGVAEFYGQVITTLPEFEPVIHFDRGLSNNIVSIWGAVPAGADPIKRWVAVYDAQTYFMTALKEVLEQKGISISGEALATHREWVASQDYEPLFNHLSPPLSSIVQVINKDSQNLYAESLLRRLGAEMTAADTLYAGVEEDVFKVGRQVVKEWESDLVGSSTGFALVDGSGMSRRNLMSASELMKILVHMNRSPYRDEFFASLAVPGEGTLKYRFFGLPEGIFLHAKSGSMTRLRALSGYLADDAGPRIAFAMICNNYLCNSDEVEAAMENICQLLGLYLKESLN